MISTVRLVLEIQGGRRSLGNRLTLDMDGNISSPLPTLLVDAKTLKILNANKRLCELTMFDLPTILEMESVRTLLTIGNLKEQFLRQSGCRILREWNKKCLNRNLLFRGVEDEGVFHVRTLSGQESPVQLAIENLGEQLLVSIIECGDLLNIISIQSVTEFSSDSLSSPELEAGVKISFTKKSHLLSKRYFEIQNELRTVFDTALDCLVVINDSGIIERINPATTSLFGYSAVEMIGNNISMLMPSPHREQHDMYISNYLRTGVKQVIGMGREVKGQKKDGTIFPIELGVTEMTIGGSRKFTGLIRDLTQSIAEQERANEAELELKSVFDTVMDCLLVINEVGTIQRLNPATVKLFGYEIEELLGNNISILMPSPYREAHDSYLKNYLNSGVKKVIGIGREVKGMKKDGTVFPMELEVTEMNVNGQRMFTGLLRDITDKISARQRIIDSERTLLFSFMSHELRTPLNGIIGMIAVLLETDHSEEQEQYLKIANESSNSLLHIINNILDHSKLEASKMSLDNVVFDMYNLCSSVLELQHFSIKGKQVDLLLDYSFDAFTQAIGDPQRLRQILLNIIGNAVKFTKEGFISVKLRTNEGKIDIRIKDTGAGMSNDQRENLFNSLYQTKAAVSSQYGGTGLGMAISYKLVKLMNGDLKVKSAVGEGSEFFITLPLSISKGIDRPLIPSNVKVMIYTNVKHIEMFLFDVLKDASVNVLCIDSDLRRNLKEHEPTHLFVDYSVPDSSKTFTEDTIFSEFPSVMFLLVTSGRLSDKESIKNRKICKKPLLSRDIINHLISIHSNAVPNKYHKPSGMMTEQERTILERKSVLVVDDNAINRKVIVTLLQKLGMKDIKEAENGPQAFQEVQQGRFDLIFLDLFMPIWSGYETCEKIRSVNSEVSIIALTAETTEGIEEKCSTFGMQGYLSKPIQMNLLIEKLRAHLIK